MLMAPLAAPLAARSDFPSDGQNWREIPLAVADPKPMIVARVGDMGGRIMFDNGTSKAVFLNRDAASLPGASGGQGFCRLAVAG